MGIVIADRVKESSTTSGTGTLTLAGSATGYQTFAAAFSDGALVPYTIVDAATGDWESGLGTYTTSTLARTLVLASSNAGAAVTFGTGEKDVFVGPLAGLSTAVRHNLNPSPPATPTASDNLSLGYGVGSIWQKSQEIWVCSFSTTSMANWRCIANNASSLSNTAGTSALSAYLATTSVDVTGSYAATIAASGGSAGSTNAGLRSLLTAAYEGGVGANANDSLSHGHRVQAVLPYSHNHGFSSDEGDSTYARFAKTVVGFTASISGATPVLLTTVYNHGGSIGDDYKIGIGEVHAFRGLVVARGDTGRYKAWEITGAIYNEAGTTALLGTPTITEIGSVGTDIASVVVAITADNATDQIAITVTGLVGVVFKWLASVEFAYISAGAGSTITS